jgi:hypothetical protein
MYLANKIPNKDSDIRYKLESARLWKKYGDIFSIERCPETPPIENANELLHQEGIRSRYTNLRVVCPPGKYKNLKYDMSSLGDLAWKSHKPVRWGVLISPLNYFHILIVSSLTEETLLKCIQEYNKAVMELIGNDIIR